MGIWAWFLLGSCGQSLVAGLLAVWTGAERWVGPQPSCLSVLGSNWPFLLAV